ncbi:MAG: hypothetical protein JSS81_23275 [Acidobacteria bacterium]|nr:hypothetical protein [Acidobacteriota bacterium]
MKQFKMILNLTSTGRRIFSLALLLALGSLAVLTAGAQEPPEPAQTPLPCPPGVPCKAPKTTPKTAPVPKNTSKPKVVVTVPVRPPETTVVVNEGDTPAEKFLAVESKVYVSLCVKRADSVRINGWDRDEIRAFVDEGSAVGFKIGQDSPKTKKPVLVYVLGFDPRTNREVKPEECLSGRAIELDVPRAATVKLKSMESDTRIESVGKVFVESLNGDIHLNDITGGVDATTYDGDVTVENSSGQFVLNNNGAGNVLAFGVNPDEIGDIFKAKSNSGRITLKDVGHRQIETNSGTGSIVFDGELLSGGQYRFAATNGSILLNIPANSLCKIVALFGFGAFSSDIPLQNTLKKEQSLTGQLGTEDKSCNLYLTTGSGVIRLKKRQ